MSRENEFRASITRRLIVGITALGTVAAFAVTTASNAVATIALSTSTAVTATPRSSTEGTAVTLKATVKVLGVGGLGVTPKGSVTFTATNGSASAVLGSAGLSPCLLSSCDATLVTSAMPIGSTSVRASYPGDGLSGPSHGTTAVSVVANPTPGTSSTVICYAGQPCNTGTITSAHQPQTLEVSTPGSSSNQTLSGSLTPGALHCVEPASVPDNDNDEDDGAAFPGDLATFSSTATDVGKTIRYTGSGALGTLMQHEYSEHTLYVGCFASPHPFKGYSNAMYGDAPFITADGLYEAQLSNCANNSGTLPCFTNVAGPGSSTDSYVVTTSPGDPKFIG